MFDTKTTEKSIPMRYFLVFMKMSHFQRNGYHFVKFKLNNVSLPVLFRCTCSKKKKRRHEKYRINVANPSKAKRKTRNHRRTFEKQQLSQLKRSKKN